MRAIKDWFTKKPAHGKKKTNFPPVIASLRKLTVCAASTLLECFDRTMDKVDRNSLVGDMTNLRNRGVQREPFSGCGTA